MLNHARRYVLQRLLEQQDKLGFIQVNILKGRQQGMSTLISGLIFWKSSMTPCMNATLAPKDFKATKSLFDKIKRFAYTRPIDQSIQVEAFEINEKGYFFDVSLGQSAMTNQGFYSDNNGLIFGIDIGGGATQVHVVIVKDRMFNNSLNFIRPV